jgi:hypothetical protein
MKPMVAVTNIFPQIALDKLASKCDLKTNKLGISPTKVELGQMVKESDAIICPSSTFVGEIPNLFVFKSHFEASLSKAIWGKMLVTATIGFICFQSFTSFYDTISY